MLSQSTTTAAVVKRLQGGNSGGRSAEVLRRLLVDLHRAPLPPVADAFADKTFKACMAVVLWPRPYVPGAERSPESPRLGHVYSASHREVDSDGCMVSTKHNPVILSAGFGKNFEQAFNTLSYKKDVVALFPVDVGPFGIIGGPGAIYNLYGCNNGVDASIAKDLPRATDYPERTALCQRIQTGHRLLTSSALAQQYRHRPVDYLRRVMYREYDTTGPAYDASLYVQRPKRLSIFVRHDEVERQLLDPSRPCLVLSGSDFCSIDEHDDFWHDLEGAM